MSTKEKPASVWGSFALWATDMRLNLDTVVERGTDGQIHYCVRLRPWKQDKRYPKMFVAEGMTMEDAAKAAYAVYTTGEEQALDYAYRPWRVVALGTAVPDFDPPF